MLIDQRQQKRRRRARAIAVAVRISTGTQAGLFAGLRAYDPRDPAAQSAMDSSSSSRVLRWALLSGAKMSSAARTRSSSSFPRSERTCIGCFPSWGPPRANSSPLPSTGLVNPGDVAAQSASTLSNSKYWPDEA